jgi:hypothetical protein
MPNYSSKFGKMPKKQALVLLFEIQSEMKNTPRQIVMVDIEGTF